jgi:hypothetical protein
MNRFSKILTSTAAALSLTAFVNGAFAQETPPPMWRNEFGVQVRNPVGITGYAGTDGIRASESVGWFNGSVGPGGSMNAGVGGCAPLYLIPTPAGLAGGRVCSHVRPDGLRTQVAPGILLPNGTEVNAVWSNYYNPFGANPQDIDAANGYAEQVAAYEAEMAQQYVAERAVQMLSEAERNAIEMEFRRHAAQYAYNPPADLIDPYTAAYPGGQAPEQHPSNPSDAFGAAPDQRTSYEPEMSDEAFRAQMAESMRRFQEADAQVQAEIRTQTEARRSRRAPSQETSETAPPSTPSMPEETASRPRPTVTYNEYAPRNGYDAQGYNPNSTRQRYDAQGYRVANDGVTPMPRQNRVYTTDGASRPIGRSSNYSNAAAQYSAVQQQSNARIAEIMARRNSSANSTSNVSSTTYSAPANNGPNTSNYDSPTSNAPYTSDRPRIVMDDNVPRASSNRNSQLSGYRYDEAAPRTPAVAPRQAGQSSSTAALQFP